MGAERVGLTIALVADLGGGAKLWLKADAQSQGSFEAAGCARFTYQMRQGEGTVARGLNYYNPPDEAMDAAHAMAAWARLALESALKARALADLKAGSRKAHAPKRKPATKDLRPVTGKAAKKPQGAKISKTPQG